MTDAGITLNLDEYSRRYIEPAVEELRRDLMATLGRKRLRAMMRRVAKGRMTLDDIWQVHSAARDRVGL